MTIYKPMLLSLGVALLTVSCTALSSSENVEASSAPLDDAIVQSEKIAQSEKVATPLDNIPPPSNDASVQDEALQSEDTLSADEPVIALGESANGMPVPIADSSGDFSKRIGYNLWTVVDTDPAGVNCRWSPDMPEQWYSPDTTWQNNDFQNWPVVRTFEYGTELISDGTPAGFMSISDSRGLPWLKIQIGDNSQICLVRANTRYIVPRS